MTIEIGGRLWTVLWGVIFVVLVIEWWRFRAGRGR